MKQGSASSLGEPLLTAPTARPPLRRAVAVGLTTVGFVVVAAASLRLVYYPLLTPLFRSDAAPVCSPEVWLIRHGEKNRENGELNAEGFARAEFLRTRVQDGHWPKFRAVFATNPNATGCTIREVQTVAPLIGALGVPMNTQYAKNEERALSLAARAAAQHACGPVLVVWEHCRIAAIAHELGCNAPRCLSCWDDGVFGAVLRLSVGQAGSTATLLEQPSSEESPAGDGQSLGWVECANPTANAQCCSAKEFGRGGCGGPEQSSGWHCPCQLGGRWVDLSGSG